MRGEPFNDLFEFGSEPTLMFPIAPPATGQSHYTSVSRRCQSPGALCLRYKPWAHPIPTPPSAATRAEAPAGGYVGSAGPSP
jgi:hypothetical protein